MKKVFVAKRYAEVNDIFLFLQPILYLLFDKMTYKSIDMIESMN